MAKTIAIYSTTTRLADLLRAKGYKLIDLATEIQERHRVDAIISCQNLSFTPGNFLLLENTDLTVGSIEFFPDENTEVIRLNVVGLSPEQALSTLEGRLRHRHWVN